MRIAHDDLRHPAVVALLERHVAEAVRNSPPGRAYVLDIDRLRDPALTVFAAWDGDALMGLGALRALGGDHGEIKSMRTAPAHARKGVARAMLAHLLGEARARGYARVSLETGASDAFAAARALYEGAGFVACPAFGDYRETEFNRYYSLAL